MGETSGSGSCEEEVPNDHRPGVEDDSHGAYNHCVDDDPEGVRYVRDHDVCDQVHPVCVPGHGEAYDQVHQACVPARVEVFYLVHQASLPVRV